MFWLRPGHARRIPSPVARQSSARRSLARRPRKAAPCAASGQPCTVRGAPAGLVLHLWRLEHVPCLGHLLHRRGCHLLQGRRHQLLRPATPPRPTPAPGAGAAPRPPKKPRAAAPWQSRGTKGKEENEEWAPHAASAFLDWTRGMDEKAVGSSTLCLAFYSFALTFS